MSKTLGQVAYDAFGAGTPRNPPWSKLWKQEQKWWQAAAEAVVAVTTAPNIVSGVIDTKTGNVRIHSPAELTARDKVIEAAKAYCAGVNGLPGSTADLDLYRAVEALLAAEGEE